MADNEPKTPTANEAMFFFHIMTHMNSKPDIDWEGVAAAQGLKSAEVAKVRFGQVKRKLGISNEGTTPVKKSSAASADTGRSPAKVKKNTGRAGGKKTPAVKTEEKQKGLHFLKDEDEEDEKKVKLEKAAAEPKTPTDTDQHASFQEWLQK